MNSFRFNTNQKYLIDKFLKLTAKHGFSCIILFTVPLVKQVFIVAMQKEVEVNLT